jgi:hypothetical protein
MGLKQLEIKQIVSRDLINYWRKLNTVVILLIIHLGTDPIHTFELPARSGSPDTHIVRHPPPPPPPTPGKVFSLVIHRINPFLTKFIAIGQGTTY